MNDTKGHSFADAGYGNVKIVREHMDKMWNDLIKPALIRSDYGDRDTFIKGLFLRAFGLLKTLENLKGVSDTQAIISTYRSLLEITVDVLFLHHDKTNQTGWKMYWWGLSEKLKGAEQIIQYYVNRGLPVPQEHEPIETFYKQEKLVIEDMRGKLWPNSKKSVHPGRWSGRKCAMAFLRCADLGMFCTKIVLKDFGLIERLFDLRDRLDQVNINRLGYFNERAKQ